MDATHQVNNLETDFCDGIKLIALVEALVKEEIPGRVIRSENQIYWQTNVSLALKFLKASDLNVLIQPHIKRSGERMTMKQFTIPVPSQFKSSTGLTLCNQYEIVDTSDLEEVILTHVSCTIAYLAQSNILMNNYSIDDYKITSKKTFIGQIKHRSFFS